MRDKYLLSINTVNGSCSVAVSKAMTVLTTKSVVADKGYSEIMMPLIESALYEVDLQVNQLDGFLVCTGPGNYTSIRIAVATARGLSLACDKPASGLSLFELLAEGIYQSLVLVKGPGGTIYTQKFSNGLAMSSPQLMTMDEIQTTKEFFDFNTVGYQAKRVGQILNSKESHELTDISFETFVALGLRKLNSNSPRPAPIYIK